MEDTVEGKIRKSIDALNDINITHQPGTKFIAEFKLTLTNYLSVLDEFTKNQQDIKNTIEQNGQDEKELNKKLEEWKKLYEQMLKSFSEINYLSDDEREMTT